MKFIVIIRPYINAETSGGGFPGWGTYAPGLWRTSNTTYFEAYKGYIQTVGSLIAKNQITKGGPVILVQVSLSNPRFELDSNIVWCARRRTSTVVSKRLILRILNIKRGLCKLS